MIGSPGSRPRRRRMPVTNETHSTYSHGPLDSRSRGCGKQYQDMLIDTHVCHIREGRGLGGRDGRLILGQATENYHDQSGHDKGREYSSNPDNRKTQTLLQFRHYLITTSYSRSRRSINPLKPRNPLPERPNGESNWENSCEGIRRYKGIFPCFLAGLVSRLLIRASNDFARNKRVSAGSITSSTSLRAAATYGVANCAR